MGCHAKAPCHLVTWSPSAMNFFMAYRLMNFMERLDGPVREMPSQAMPAALVLPLVALKR